MLVLASLSALAQDSEEALQEKAIALFMAEDYEQAIPIYSQLLSLNLQSPEYNFRFGACQMFVNDDKEEGLKYLGFAAKDKTAPALAHYYYGLGLHFNYRFDKAIDEYQKYKADAGKKEPEAKMVDHNIEQCVSGKNLVSRFTDINVIENSVLPRSDFFRNYDLREIGGKIIVKPEEFMSEEDLKRDARFLMYFQQNSDFIYYASYSDKNATGKDLYSITKLPTGDWSKPIRLSEVINTPYDEDFPFIHPDGSSLYFASKGHNSMGGYDIFKSTRTAQGTFTQPINQEFAINTPWDDFMFITDKGERLAWFASNRVTDSKSVTVYKISMDRVPLDLTLIKGSFITETNSKKAKITVEDMVQGKTIGVYESERQLGGYLLDLRGSGKYKFIVEAEESSLVHTGIVEVPRQKGLKQFRQEMKLVTTDGNEQLQIINHFDEPLEGEESLLTAEILKKQASLNVNADAESFVRSTEILDDGSSSAEGIAKMDRIGFATTALDDTKSDIKELDQRAAYLYEKASKNANSSDQETLAEATLAAEIALKYKKAADEKRASLSRMEDALDAYKQSTGNEGAEKAKFNQFQSISDNQKDVAEIEKDIESILQSRVKPMDEDYEQQQAKVDELEDDLKEINAEIAYYREEIENSKDQAVKEELEFQITEAQAAIPEKEAKLEKSKMRLATAASSAQVGNALLSTWLDLVTESSKNAAATESTVKVSSISVLSQSLKQKARSNPPLLAVVDPQSAPEKSTEETDADVAAENSALNQEIQEISEPSKVDRIEGDYNDYFLEQLSKAGSSADKLNAEMRKAELYDQWADNIDLRSDSLATEIQTSGDPALKTSLIDDRKRLQKESETKRELALESYQAVAVMNDQEAELAAQLTPEQSPVEETAEGAETPENTEAAETVEEVGAVETVETIPSEPEPAEPEGTEQSKAPVIAKPSIPQTESEKLTEQFETALAKAESIENETERKQKIAEINREWASAIQKERDKLALAMEQTEDETERAELQEQSAKLSTEQQQKQALAAQLTRENNETQENGVASVSDAELEQQLFPLIENYNKPSFQQIETQIAKGADTPQKDLKTLTLARNWLLAIQNQEVKTEARIANTSDQTTKRELSQTQVALASDKAEVRQKIAELSGEESSASSTASSSDVQLKASERFEGYLPVETDAVAKAEENVATYSAQEENLESDIASLETKKSETKKKKDVAALELMLDMKRNELAIIQTKNAFYQEAASKLEAVEADLIQFKPKDQLASERQQAEVESLDQEATTAKEEAAEQRSGAESIKNKNERAAALRDVENYERTAAQKSMKATLSKDLVAEMQAIEEAAIQKNFIVLPGREATLPVVKRELNPAEIADIEATPEFREYAAAIGESDDFGKEAKAKELEEQRLRNEAQEALTSAALAANQEERGRLTETAYASFEKADRLSEESARLKRRSAFVRNEANSDLLQRPEEVYLNVIAAMQSRPAGAIGLPVVATPVGNPPASGPDLTEQQPEETEGNNDIDPVAQNTGETPGPDTSGILEEQIAPGNSNLAGTETDSGNRSEQPSENIAANEVPVQNPPARDENERAQGGDNEFELTPPTESRATVPVQEDKLTNTIFEIAPQVSAPSNDKPIPMNKPLPSGVVYKIQVGAFRSEIPSETFGNMKPLVGESAGNGLIRYTVGLFKNFSDAEQALERVKTLGYGDAFIVSYFNSSRVPVTEAQSVERNEISTPPSYSPETNVGANNTPSRPVADPNNLRYISQGPLQIEDVNNTPELFYAVQVGVFGRPVSSAEIKNITPLNQENMPNGNYRYSTGKFNSFESATLARDEVRALGIRDAFVVAYKEGQRLAGNQIPKSNAGGGTQNIARPVVTPPVTQPTNPATGAPVARIKLGTFAGEIPVSQASVILSLSGQGVDKEKNADGTNSYFYGSFATQAEAEAAAQDLQQKGLTQATVVPAP